VNREAELDRPSRVACSDLLGGAIISSMQAVQKMKIRKGLECCKEQKRHSKHD
jgi:hypothetical protein